MNIGIDIRPLMSNVKTGIGEYTQEILDAIFDLDKANHYWLFYNSAKPVEQFFPNWKAENIHFIGHHWPNKIFNLLVAAKIIQLNKLIPKKLDYWYSPNLNFTNLSGGLPHILTIHDLSFEIFPEFFTIQQRLWHKFTRPKKQCEQASRIITPSENTKRDLIKKYQIPVDKIQVIYPGLSPKMIVDSDDLEKQKIIVQSKYSLPANFILYFGSIEPRKNILTAIKGYEKFASTMNTDFHLVIAGAAGWKNKEIYRHVEQSKYNFKIHFLGYIPPEDKPALYALSKIFLFPSFYEGFGFPLIEAMSLGVPSITSNCSSLPEITQNAAHLINPNNSQEIANALTLISNNKKIRELMIERGFNESQKFNWPATAQVWLKLITSINQ